MITPQLDDHVASIIADAENAGFEVVLLDPSIKFDQLPAEGEVGKYDRAHLGQINYHSGDAYTEWYLAGWRPKKLADAIEITSDYYARYFDEEGQVYNEHLPEKWRQTPECVAVRLKPGVYIGVHFDKWNESQRVALWVVILPSEIDQGRHVDFDNLSEPLYWRSVDLPLVQIGTSSDADEVLFVAFEAYC